MRDSNVVWISSRFFSCAVKVVDFARSADNCVLRSCTCRDTRYRAKASEENRPYSAVLLFSRSRTGCFPASFEAERQRFHNRIVLLINEWTNSAAEMVANFAAENRLATLVGRRTRGNVLGAANFKVGGGYWLRLPIFGWFTSQGRSLDGAGVDPDIDVDICPEELAGGKDRQLLRAIEILSEL